MRSEHGHGRMHGGKSEAPADRRAARGRMWSMCFCLGVSILVLLSLFSEVTGGMARKVLIDDAAAYSTCTTPPHLSLGGKVGLSEPRRGGW